MVATSIIWDLQRGHAERLWGCWAALLTTQSRPPPAHVYFDFLKPRGGIFLEAKVKKGTRSAGVGSVRPTITLASGSCLLSSPANVHHAPWGHHERSAPRQNGSTPAHRHQ